MIQPHLRFVSRQINKNKKYGQLNLFKFFERGKVFKFNSGISREKGFYSDRDYLVVWYGHIRQNERSNTSQILVKVALLELFDKHEEYIVIEIPFNYIIKVPIGSVWCNGVWKYQFEFDENKLQINKKNTKFNSYNSSSIEKFAEEYPVVLHKSRLSFIEVNYTDENDNPQTLLIHPLIFFMAHYGYSTELKRILLIHPWGEEGQLSNFEQDTVIGRFLLEKNNTQIYNSVYLPSRFAKRDAVLLHFLKTNRQARSIVKKLVNDIRTNAINRNKDNDNKFSKKIDLPVKPWHSDEIQFTFKSLRLNSKLSICTEITGMSEPELPENDIINLILSPSFKDKLDIDKDLKDVLDGYYQPIRKKENLSNIDLNPDDYASSLEVAVVKKILMILGQQCSIQVNREEYQKECFRQALYAPEASSYAAGDVVNNRGDVGWVEAVFEDRPDDERNKDPRQDRLGELWNYAKELSNKINGEVKAGWFTFSTGFNQNDDFIVMKLTHKLLCPKSYPYEILVLRIIIDNEFYYVLDSDKRPNKKTGMPGVIVKVNDEESFLYNYDIGNHKGLISILITLAHNEGSLTEDYIDSFNGNMAVFRHSSPHAHSRGDNQINWILNGLKKLNTSINFK